MPSTVEQEVITDDGLDSLAEEIMNENDYEVEETEEETSDEEETQVDEDLDGEENQDEDEDEVEETEEEENESDETDEEETPADNTRRKKSSSQRFAEMRVQNKNYENALKLSAQNAGFDNVDDFIADQEQKRIEAEAAKNNISPEIFAKLEQLERTNAEREQEQLAIRFQTKADNLKSEFGLNDTDVRNFVNQCFAAGITDLHSDAVDLKALYRGFNFDAVVESERQKWISKDEKNRTSTSKVNTGKGSPSIESKKTLENYDDFENVFSKIKQ